MKGAKYIEGKRATRNFEATTQPQLARLDEKGLLRSAAWSNNLAVWPAQ